MPKTTKLGVRIPYSKPKDRFNHIMFVAEAPGANEVEKGKMLIGRAGKLFDGVLAKAGIKRKASLLANVFRYRPPENKVMFFFTGFIKKAADASPFVPYKNKLLRKEYAGEIKRLRKAIAKHKPRVVVAMGATAIWATAMRSDASMTDTFAAEPIKFALPNSKGQHFYQVIPTYHPAAVLRNPDWMKHMAKSFKRAKTLAKKRIEP